MLFLIYNVRYMDKTPQRRQPPVGVFVATSVVIFFLSLSAADSVGLVPYYIDGTAPAVVHSDELTLSQLPTLGAAATATAPVRIQAPAIGLDLSVQNPETRDISALDTLLQNGPARYVDSAKLGVPGNVLIFAHSSHLPIVHNQMFRAFNRVPELAAGDSITLTGSDGTAYLYSVVSVRKADANDAVIDLSPKDGTRLTLVTCDTLTGKSARFILEATLVGNAN